MCKIARFREQLARAQASYTRRGHTVDAVSHSVKRVFVDKEPIIIRVRVCRALYGGLHCRSSSRASAQKSQDVRSSILSPKKIAGSIGN